MSIQQLRSAVHTLHQDLVRAGLVAWTSGNISARVPGDGIDSVVVSRAGFRAPVKRSENNNCQ